MLIPFIKQKIIVVYPDMTEKHVNLIKMCVGAESVSDLHDWQEQRLFKNPKSDKVCTRHVTRMRPKREEEVLNGGSLYWVFKGYILARQEIVGLEKILGNDNVMRCAIILDSQIILTETKRKRPFQGWRYLTFNHAPKDVKIYSEGDIELPLTLERNLMEIGVF